MNSLYKTSRRLAWISSSILTVMIFILLPIHMVDAETADGYYEIDYEVLNADNDSVSVANDYFDKPAVLIVEKGERYLQMGINHSNWVVGLQAPDGDDFVDVDVISEDEEEDVRIVQFVLDEDENLDEPVEMKMHIVVDVLEEDYDHHYTARFQFDEESMTEVDAPLGEEEVEDDDAVAEEEATDSDTDETAEKESDTKTDDDKEIKGAGVNAGTMIVIVLLVGIAAVLLYSFVFKKKK